MKSVASQKRKGGSAIVAPQQRGALPLRPGLKNYTVLSLNGDDEDVRIRWMRSIRDLRSWCFNSTNNHFKFGNEPHQCAMIPQEGHFFIYLTYNDKWLCLVIEGSTLYLVGFITSSIGPNLRIQEIDNYAPFPITYIERSVKMSWMGNYWNAEECKVGAQPLRSAFGPMYRHTARQCPRPSDQEIRKWCDILIIHFPEAARFDSLLLCNINLRFSESGKVGKRPVTKATQWSKDCQTALKQMTMTQSEISESKSKKDKLKKSQSKSKKDKLKMSKISKRKALQSELSGTTEKRCKVMSDKEIQRHIEDVRLFHRSNPCHATVTLSSLPIQLCNGKAIDYCAEDLKEDLDEEMNFLIQPINGFCHDSCCYVDGEWLCLSYLSDSEQPALQAKTSDSICLSDSEQPAMQAKTSDSICLSDSEQPALQAKTSDSICLSDSEQPALQAKTSDSICLSDSEQSAMQAETSDSICFSDFEQLMKAKTSDSICLNAGLFNLGNTCYVNSTLQCMYSIPELKSALQSYPGTTSVDNVDQDSHNLTLATHDTFVALDQSDSPVSPLQFLEALRKKYPIFAAQTDDGFYIQQDAEECWTQLVQTLSETLVAGGVPTRLPVKELFGIGLVSSEDGMDTGSVYSLKCEISQDVNHIQEGLKHGLKTHSGESKIDELPKYLTVQFGRVFWDSETEQMSKILRKVAYPLELDMYEHCSDELKQKLGGLWQGSSSSAWEPSNMDIDKGESSNMDDKDESSNMEIDNTGPSTKLTGIYDLIAVISHKGSTADSGHYVSWVKQDGIWIQFDDDKRCIHDDKDILKLSGGGEGHMAYICLYKARLAQ